MRIAVVGAQNVGKTTFINDFVKVFSEYNSYVSSLKNIANEKGLQLNQMTSEETQFLIMQHLNKLISENKKENVIFDRCLIDNHVYSYCAYLKGKISEDFIEASKETMFGHLQFLDLIVFIPVSLSVEISPEQQRDVDKNFIDLVNRVFVEILLEISRSFKIKICVLSGFQEERIKQIKKYL